MARVERGMGRGRELLRGSRDRILDSGDRLGRRARRARKQVTRMLPARRRRVERRWRAVWFVGGSAAGAVVAMLLDPVRGRARRARIASQTGGMVRRMVRRTNRAGRRVVSDVEGWTEAAVYGRGDQPPENDATLAHKVQSEVFGRADVPKGSINVNAVEGLVVLRGQVKRPEDVNRIEELVRKVPGVRGVESYLHLEGTLPPNKAEAMRTTGRAGGTGSAIE